MGDNRIGRVSAIDYESGTYEVTYFDRDQSVTSQISAVSNGEYRMPKVGDMVSVFHSSSGSSQAVAAGTIWNDKNRPAEGYEGLYRKEFGNENGQAYERYDANTGEYMQYANGSVTRKSNGNIQDVAEGDIEVTAKGKVKETILSGLQADIHGNVTISANGASITISSGGDISITSPSKISLAAPDIKINGTSGDVKVNTISLTQHTHENGGAGRPV